MPSQQGKTYQIYLHFIYQFYPAYRGDSIGSRHSDDEHKWLNCERIERFGLTLIASANSLSN